MATIKSIVQLVISAVDRGLENTIGRLSGSLTSFKGIVASVGVALTGLFVGDKIRSFLQGAAQEAQDAEQRFGRLEGAIKATGGAAGLSAQEIRDFASDLDEATLGSAAAIEDAAAKLLTFRTIAGDVFFRTLEAAQDLSEVFKQDISQSAVQLGKALEDPIKGVGALGRVGVSFNESQKELIKTLVESNKLIEAQGIILEVVEGQVKGVASAAGAGLAGALDLVGKRFTDLKRKIGDSIIPAANGFYLSLAENLGAINEKVTELSRSGRLSQIAEAIAGVFKEGATAVKDFLLSIDLTNAASRIKQFGADVTQTLTTIGRGAGALNSFLSTVFNGFFATINGALAGVLKTFQILKEREAKGLAVQIEQLENRLKTATEEQRKSIEQGLAVFRRQSNDLKIEIEALSVLATDAAGRSVEAFNAATGSTKNFVKQMDALNAAKEKSNVTTAAVTKTEKERIAIINGVNVALGKYAAAERDAATATGLRAEEIKALGLQEVEEIARIEELANLLEKDRVARNKARAEARQRAESLQKEAEAQEDVAEATNASAEAAGSLNDIISFVISSLRKMSDTATNNFLGVHKELGAMSTELKDLETRLLSVSQTIERNLIFKLNDGFNRFVQRFHQVTVEFLESAIEVQRWQDQLESALESGRIGSIDLAQAAAAADSALQNLDGHQVEPLRDAIQEIRDQLRALDEEVRESVRRTGIELARLRGDQRTADLLELEADIAERLAENQERLTRARRAGQQDLISLLKAERIEIQEIQKLREREIQQASRERQQRSERPPENVIPLTPRGAAGGIAPASGLVASAGASAIEIGDAVAEAFKRTPLTIEIDGQRLTGVVLENITRDSLVTP